jgi:cephalosporin hydroxylase
MNPKDIASRLYDITGGSQECGWMCDAVADFTHALVKFYRPDLVIQTGHLWGKSAAYILSALAEPPLPLPESGDKVFDAFVHRRIPTNPLGRLISIDPKPMGVPHHDAGIEFLQKTFPGRFEFVQSTSVDFFKHFSGDGLRIVGLVDGDHTDKGCEADIRALAKLGAEIIIVDDTRWIPTLRGVGWVTASQLGYDFAEFQIYNGIAVLTRIKHE